MDTVFLAKSALMSQCTVRVGRGMSVILLADADLGKLDPAAPRLAGRSDECLSTEGEISANIGGDFLLGNSRDKNRNFARAGDA